MNQRILQKCLRLAGVFMVIITNESYHSDLRMIDGCRWLKATNTMILKIGFLNSNFDTYLPKYIDGYDFVIVDDQSVDIIKQVLDALLGDASVK